jgi:hypothetical protein
MRCERTIIPANRHVPDKQEEIRLVFNGGGELCMSGQQALEAKKTPEFLTQASLTMSATNCTVVPTSLSVKS